MTSTPQSFYPRASPNVTNAPVPQLSSAQDNTNQVFSPCSDPVKDSQAIPIKSRSRVEDRSGLIIKVEPSSSSLELLSDQAPRIHGEKSIAAPPPPKLNSLGTMGKSDKGSFDRQLE